MKGIVLMAALLTLPTFLFARDKMDGCGLGWEVTNGSTVSATTTRATTNAVVPPTFGMTSGTMGCNQFTGIASLERKNAEFVAQNYDVIKSELAAGKGEYATATAESFNCDASVFTKAVQENFDTIVAPAKDGVELFNQLKLAAKNICA
jgi:hypothetical protein